MPKGYFLQRTLALVFLSPLLLLGLFPQSAGSQEIRVILGETAPVRDPEHPLWERVPGITVPLLPQNFVAPSLTKPTVTSLTVKALRDREDLAILLIWKDPTRDLTVDVDRFCDQVAVMFPLDPTQPPSFMMGNKGGQVHILHWKARWQDDLDRGYQDVQTLYPNYWVDLYFFHDRVHFAEGEIPEEPSLRYFRTPEALNYMPGIYARNPVSTLNRQEPVEELMAQGYGSLTTQPKQNARGKGVWKKGEWKVVLSRPLVSDDPLDAPLPGQTFVAFAVWDGSARNVGARKMVTAWFPLLFPEAREKGKR